MSVRLHHGCAFGGCDQPHMAKGLCDGHYLQMRAGKPLAVLARREQHGLSRDPLYKLWCAIKSRTSCANHTAYSNYGGRGIRLHEDWHLFSRFYADIMGSIGPRPGSWREYQLDRIDNDGDYAPGNVRWSTPTENAANKREFVLIPADELAALRAELEAHRAGA